MHHHHHLHRPQNVTLGQFLKSKDAPSNASSNSSGSASPQPPARPAGNAALDPQTAAHQPGGAPSRAFTSTAPNSSAAAAVPRSAAAGGHARGPSPGLTFDGSRGMQRSGSEVLTEAVAAWRGPSKASPSPQPPQPPAAPKPTWASKVAAATPALERAAAASPQLPLSSSPTATSDGPHCSPPPPAPCHARPVAQQQWQSLGQARAQQGAGGAEAEVVLAALVGEVEALRAEVAHQRAALRQAELGHQQELASVLRDAAYHEMQVRRSYIDWESRHHGEPSSAKLAMGGTLVSCWEVWKQARRSGARLSVTPLRAGHLVCRRSHRRWRRSG